MKKAQAGIEIIFAVSVVFALFMIVLVFSSGKYTELKKTKEYMQMDFECERISSAISAVYLAGDGTSMFLDKEYTISLAEDGEIVIESGVKGVNSFSCSCNARIKETLSSASKTIKIYNLNNEVGVEDA